ncbi:MAG: glycine C-acetyltransferase [Pseudomonadota bacterium]
MTDRFRAHITRELDSIEAEGLMKRERPISGPQGARIEVGGAPLLNLCANNYLGLADHPALAAAASEAMETNGYGMASVRFICGTATLHEELEARLARYLGMEDSILFAACFDANGGVFEPLFGPEDAIISDALNHASLIDGIRLCKAQRFRYKTNDMADLEAQLRAAQDARFRIIVTDGVFSMDGTIANLPEITRLARQYDAMTLVDDCHATGFMGPKGAGTHVHCGAEVTLLTGTLGKALGGAMGGYVAGPAPLIQMLRQRARPYLFSNALPPAVVAASLKALDLVEEGDELRARLFENAEYWRAGLTKLGFTLLPGEHPIIPVMLGEAPLAQKMAARLFELGVYVSGFFFPVVPKGQARIRTQMNAALTQEDLDAGLAAFAQAGRELGIIPEASGGAVS